MSKPSIEKEILSALFIITRNDPTVKVERLAIIDQVRMQIKGIRGFPQSHAKQKNLISSSIYKMKKDHRIGYVGRNQYTMLDSPMTSPPKKDVKIPPGYFQVPSKKRRLPESFTKLDPAAKRRNSETSVSSFSGDQFQRRLKQFHGQKKIIIPKPSPPLPGARQVQSSIDANCSCWPSTSNLTLIDSQFALYYNASQQVHQNDDQKLNEEECDEDSSLDSENGNDNLNDDNAISYADDLANDEAEDNPDYSTDDSEDNDPDDVDARN